VATTPVATTPVATTPVATTPAPAPSAEVVVNGATSQSATVSATAETIVFLPSGQGVKVGAGAVPGDITVTVQVLAAPPPIPEEQAAALTLVSPVLSFAPSGQQFSAPVTLVFAVSAVAGPRKRLAVHRHNKVSRAWDEVPGTRVAGDGTVEVETWSFSSYAVFEIPAPAATTPGPAAVATLPFWVPAVAGAVSVVLFVACAYAFFAYTSARRARLLKVHDIGAAIRRAETPHAPRPPPAGGAGAPESPFGTSAPASPYADLRSIRLPPLTAPGLSPPGASVAYPDLRQPAQLPG